MIRAKRRQRGFTTVELAFAGLIAAGITLVALELLVQTAEHKVDQEGKLRANAAARQTLSLLANGAHGPGDTGAGADATDNLYGLRYRAGAPTVTLADGEVFELTSNGITVTGDRAAPITVTCTAAAAPYAACPSAGATIAVDGPVTAAPLLNDQNRSVIDRTVEYEISVMDPWAAARGRGKVERYGGMAIYNASEGEGTPGTRGDDIQ